MSSEGWEAKQRVTALLQMIREDGASPPGELPPGEHMEALERATPGEADEVAKAHREGRGPPETGEDRGSGQGGGQS